MYKGASDSEQYMNRTGSESTRFKKTGDNSELAGQPKYEVNYTADIAAEKAHRIKELQDIRSILSIRRQKLQVQAQHINKKLEMTRPHVEFTELTAQRKKIGSEIAHIQHELMVTKEELIELEAGGNKIRTFAAGFMYSAEQVLPRDVFEEILEATRLYFKERGIRHEKE